MSYLVDNFWSEIDNVEKELGKKIVEKRDRNILHTICGIMEVNALNIALGHDNNEEVSALFEWVSIDTIHFQYMLNQHC